MIPIFRIALQRFVSYSKGKSEPMAMRGRLGWNRSLHWIGVGAAAVLLLVLLWMFLRPSVHPSNWLLKNYKIKFLGVTQGTYHVCPLGSSFSPPFMTLRAKTIFWFQIEPRTSSPLSFSPTNLMVRLADAQGVSRPLDFCFCKPPIYGFSYPNPPQDSPTVTFRFYRKPKGIFIGKLSLSNPLKRKVSLPVQSLPARCRNGEVLCTMELQGWDTDPDNIRYGVTPRLRFCFWQDQKPATNWDIVRIHVYFHSSDKEEVYVWEPKAYLCKPEIAAVEEFLHPPYKSLVPLFSPKHSLKTSPWFFYGRKEFLSPNSLLIKDLPIDWATDVYTLDVWALPRKPKLSSDQIFQLTFSLPPIPADAPVVSPYLPLRYKILEKILPYLPGKLKVSAQRSLDRAISSLHIKKIHKTFYYHGLKIKVLEYQRGLPQKFLRPSNPISYLLFQFDPSPQDECLIPLEMKDDTGYSPLSPPKGVDSSVFYPMEAQYLSSNRIRLFFLNGPQPKAKTLTFRFGILRCKRFRFHVRIK